MFLSDRVGRRWRQSENTAQNLEETRRFFPTNRIRDAVYTRRGLKWGVPAMLLAAPYIAVVKLLSDVIDQAGSEWGWLHLVVLLCAWNAIKMLWLGPMSLIALARVRHREHVQRRNARRDAAASSEQADAEPALAGGAS
ncbi:hypothetical protein [Brevibacterium casei]|uniref:hypothetical protein n=1 Tax=Brevibacterium casei TaxID=33889 RepID=UPI000E64E0F6|nr:hypothetical protein [Brevibacterium casei]MBE4696169.1 hypothetical protein [Brevibacterium casei]MBY3579291.1 hypothetical protein [Brevibacterium casei]MCT1767338.1 hypothetical protein [Brevibacterium casei]